MRHRLKQLSQLLISLVAVPVAHANPPPRPSREEFLRQAQSHADSLIPSRTTLSTDSAGFISLAELIPGQKQISVDNTLAKLNERIAAGDLSWQSRTRSWVMTHDGGGSPVPTTDPITLIKGPNGYVIADGHHDVFLALYVGAKSIAATVIMDLSQKSPLEFWTELKSRDLIYLDQSPAQLAARAPRFGDIADNPNRYLAGLLALKVAAKSEAGSVTISGTKGSKSPAWIKLNDSIPFIEFFIAEVLSRSNIRYDSSWGSTIPEAVVVETRKALLAAKLRGHPQLSGVPVIESSQVASKALASQGDLAAIIKGFLVDLKMPCDILNGSYAKAWSRYRQNPE